MMNRNELNMMVNTLKKEMVEAVARGNEKLQKQIVNEIFRLESIVREFDEKKAKEKIQQANSEVVVFDDKDEEVIRQNAIVSSFSRVMREVIKKYEGTSTNKVSEKQAQTIMNGLRDRVGMDITKKQIEFINGLNFNQADRIIKKLALVSFYNQRVQLSQAILALKDREDFDMILAEVKNNIHKIDWFESNKDLITMSYELLEPTDAQVRKIADVTRYPETALALSEYGIELQDYEYRPEGKNHYLVNWELLKKDIRTKFNRESAYNFIQTYEYITNYYEGNKLDREQSNHLRNLYIQLGEYELTRLSHMATINKQHYPMIVRELERAVRMNKIANNESTRRFREALQSGDPTVKHSILVKASAKESREVRSSAIREEQEQAKDFTSFVFNIYAVVGQETPEEMRGILPYFIQGGEIKYATVEEQHYKAFRKMVFEQRDVIKSINKEFNWGAYIANQPTHILVALGLDMFM